MTSFSYILHKCKVNDFSVITPINSVLKWVACLDFQDFPMDRMAELQVFGMEVETVRRLAIEGIAHDGTVHAIGVGGMDTELVGAAGLGVVVDAGSTRVVMVVHCFYVILTTIGRKNLDDMKNVTEILR